MSGQTTASRLLKARPCGELGTITADLAVWDIEVVGTDTSGFPKHLGQIIFAKSVGTKCRQRLLLPLESRDLLKGIIFVKRRSIAFS